MSIKQKNFVDEIFINNNISIVKNNSNLHVTGPLGSVSRNFRNIPITLHLNKTKLHIKTHGGKKTDYAILHTVKSLIKNLFEGVLSGYTIKMKVVYSHFPISVKIKNNTIHIENFLGERYPRITRIHGKTNVKVVGDELILTGILLTDITQTAAEIQLKTKIKNKDPRVFLDGIYIYSKKKGI